MDLLANPFWHALVGPQADVAESLGNARRYLPHLAVFCALPDDPTPQDWADLGALVGPGNAAFLLRASVDPPDGWERRFHITGVQMVHDGSSPQRDADLELRVLHTGDVSEMLGLVERSNPGPFLARTIELGTYLGVHEDGKLVAMAGERAHAPGYVEISAVCTDPEHRGRGLASALVRELIASLNARDERAMLHTTADNENAIRLYRALGFAHTRDVVGVGCYNAA